MTPLIRLFMYARPHRVGIILAAVCSVFNTVFDILPEVLIGVAVNIVVKGEGSWMAHLGIENIRWQLLALGLITFVVWLLESMFQFFYLNDQKTPVLSKPGMNGHQIEQC